MNLEDRIAFHHRAQQSVLKKIQNVYGLTDEQLELPPAFDAQVAPIIQNVLQSEEWDDRLSALGPLMPDTQKPQTAVLVGHFMREYAKAFHLRERIIAKRNEYKSSDAQDAYHTFYYDRTSGPKTYNGQMIDLYTNHLMNKAQAELTLLINGEAEPVMPIAREAAFFLHTFLVGQIARPLRHPDSPYEASSTVYPKTYESWPVEQSLAAIAHYWPEVKKDLCEIYKKEQIVPPHHAARLQERQAESRAAKENGTSR